MADIKLEFSKGDLLGSQVLALLENLEKFSKLSQRETNKIDLSGLFWAPPLSILPLAAIIWELDEQGYRLSLTPPSGDVSSYLETIGFPSGYSKVANLPRRSTYIPIIAIDSDSSEEEKNMLISETSGFLLNRIKASTGGEITLKYGVSEMFSNIWQHSKSKRGWVLGQHYKNKRLLDICILDRGVGLRGAYSGAGVKTKDDLEAIKKALEGVSVKGDTERGMGIWTTKKLVVESPLKGSFLLITGRGGYFEDPKDKIAFELPHGFWSGVIILLRIRNAEVEFDYTKYVE